jgi:serine phosphatase RsbU (regulator of sigma subunit)
MELTMKTSPAESVSAVVPAFIVNEAALAAATGVPVMRAIAALGEPDSPGELAQRLVATVAMLWSDVAGADLFLPQSGTGELRGLRDASGGFALLSAVASVGGAGAATRIIPMSPTMTPRDPAAGRGPGMSAPVLRGSALEGFVIVQRCVGAPEFSAHDLDALATLARGVAEILPRVRARGATASNVFLQRDMVSAREVQRMFLPSPLEANSARVRVLAEYLPALAVGGDFYDVVDLGDGRIMAAIGDVSGKGVAAALMMSRISSELHRLAAETSGPAETLTRLNHSLSERMRDDRFATVVCVLLDVPGRRWVVSNAGHMVPILRRRSGAVTGLAYASGPPIGMVAGSSYEQEIFPLESRDILILATDGVFDAVSGPRRPCSTLGQCKLTALVEKASHDLAEIHRRILDTVESASAGRDDVALLGLELTE